LSWGEGCGDVKATRNNQLKFSEKMSGFEVIVQNKDIHEESLTIRIKGISGNNQLYIYSHPEGDNDND
jgi:hypothetical protein